MSYLPELHYCCVCGTYLEPDNGDGICFSCDNPTSPSENQGGEG
jgi:hypothetical protein